MMKKGTVFLVLGLLLIAAALGILGYNLWDANRAAKAADKVLAELEQYIEKDPIPVEGRPVRELEEGETPDPNEIRYPDYILNPDMEMPVSTVQGRDYIGILYIPSLDYFFPICSENTDANLKDAPCRYYGTAYKNDLVICAHNYERFFAKLRDLHYGDTVIFTDVKGNEFTYEVSEIENLRPTQNEEMVKEGDWDLTLFTCTPGAAYRVTVRCTLQ